MPPTYLARIHIPYSLSRRFYSTGGDRSPLAKSFELQITLEPECGHALENHVALAVARRFRYRWYAHLDSMVGAGIKISDETPAEAMLRICVWLLAALLLVADVAACFAQCLKMDGYQVVAVDTKSGRFIFH